MVTRLRARLRAGAADQRAFTLIETMFTAVILVVVLGGIMAASDAAERAVPKDEALAFSLRESQVALDRMTRELRQAHSLNSITATKMDANVRLRGVTSGAGTTFRRVVFDCDVAAVGAPTLKRCVRYEVSPAGWPGPRRRSSRECARPASPTSRTR